MTSTPKRPDVSIKRMLRLMVYVASEAGKEPTEADAQPYLNCVSISHGVGDNLPHATLVVDQAALGIRIGNEFVTEKMNRRVEIWTLKLQSDDDDPEGSLRDRPLFWGEITSSELQLTPDGESRILHATIEPYHFGEICHGQECWSRFGTDSPGDDEHGDPIEGGAVDLFRLDLEFNPLIRGKICPNRVPVRQDGDDTGDKIRNDKLYSIWVDPESVRSEEAIKEIHSDPQSWDLRHVIETICGMLNVADVSRLIRNPEGLEQLTRAEGIPPIKNLTLKRGGHIPHYLSEVLPQFGYQWYLKFDRVEKSDKPASETRIVIYRRAEGSKVKHLHMPPWGDPYSHETADCEALSVTFSNREVINKIYGYGAFELYELTIPLHRGWATEDDSQIATNTDPLNHVGRLWVANEGGDYTNLRSWLYTAHLFGEGICINKKRELHDCLTLRTDDKKNGFRSPPVLEISTDGKPLSDPDKQWRAVSDLDDDPESGSNFGGWSVLPGEVGIWITSPKIPEVLQATEKLDMRITGSVYSDRRLEYETDRDEQTSNSADCSLLVDLSDQFVLRKRETLDKYRSRLTGDADEQDDTEAIEQYCDRLLKQQRGAQVTASAQCPMIRDTWELGDIVQAVKGREISFNRLPKTAGESQYLQIIGITYTNDGDRQLTTLQAERYDA